jgi:hypothetical protein
MAEVINIAQMRAKNDPNRELTFLQAEKKVRTLINNKGEKVDSVHGYWFLTGHGERSYFYRTLHALVVDITDLWGHWNDFKLLV